ncbi:MAG: hypothetical protein OEQ39_18690 [Gammaproteobacteria bacterium]|nr:hypothetical protein [Gammaproteobacteria bacterium]
MSATLKGLVSQLKKVIKYFLGYAVRICYEASYVGYCLQLDLLDKGFHCDVVAPSSTPTPGGTFTHWENAAFPRRAPTTDVRVN